MCEQPAQLSETDLEAMRQRFFDLNVSFMRSRALYAAAALGIADAVAAGKTQIPALAAAVGVDARALYRLMRFLCSFGVFVEREQDRFALTEFGELLRSEGPQSMRGLVLWHGGDPYYTAWQDIVHSIRTGQQAFAHVHGEGLFEYNARHPDHNKVFNDAMVAGGTTSFNDVATAYDFSGSSRVADIGGGIGRLLVAVLTRHRHLSGVLFDSNQVKSAAQEYVRAAGLDGRCEIVSGDFFASIPAGCETYMLSRIIHDWNDERSAAILTNLRRVMNPSHRLLIIERVVPKADHPSLAIAMDMVMMIVTGGQERTEDEYRELLKGSGFRLLGVTPIADEMHVMEAAPS
jgi:hypothetical protein